MLVYKYFGTRNDGEHLVQTTSDRGMKVLQMETGLKMPDPIDVADRYFDEEAFEVKYKPRYYHYLETDELIESETPEESNL